MRFVYLSRGRTIGWFRFGREGWGLHWKNTAVEPMRFSERYGYRKPTLRIRHWWFTILHPRRPR